MRYGICPRISKPRETTTPRSTRSKYWCRNILRTGTPKMPSESSPMKLWAITDGSEKVLEQASAICGAGKSDVVIHLRERNRTGKEVLAIAERLRAITSANGSTLILGCTFDLALRRRFDGFHGR